MSQDRLWLRSELTALCIILKSLAIIAVMQFVLVACNLGLTTASPSSTPPPVREDRASTTTPVSPAGSQFRATGTMTAILQATPSATPDLMSTLVAVGPIVEVTFDGAQCTFSGPDKVPIGDIVLKYTNTTGHIASPWVARNYPGKTWQDVLDVIGAPGSEVTEDTNWIAILGYGRSFTVSPTVSYRQYKLEIAAEYHIVVEYPTDHFWPCGPFHVLASP